MRKMKKKELCAISLLSILLFVSFANISIAIPPSYPSNPSYVGVRRGDEFLWTTSLNMVNLNITGIALFGADNWTFMYNYFLEYFKNATGMEFDFFGGAGMKTVILNVTEEMPYPYMPGLNASGLFFNDYIAYAKNNWTLVSEAANYTEPMIFLIDPNTLNESTILYIAMSHFMPIGFNYSMYTNAWNTAITYNLLLNGNVTIQTQGYGFKITLKAVYLEYMFNQTGAPFEIGPLSDAVMTLRWNSIGVFDYASFDYGGLTIATAQLVPTDEDLIPGYELVTILGFSLLIFIALVYIKRKRRIFN